MGQNTAIQTIRQVNQVFINDSFKQYGAFQ